MERVQSRVRCLNGVVHRGAHGKSAELWWDDGEGGKSRGGNGKGWGVSGGMMERSGSYGGPMERVQSRGVMERVGEEGVAGGGEGGAGGGRGGEGGGGGCQGKVREEPASPSPWAILLLFPQSTEPQPTQP